MDDYRLSQQHSLSPAERLFIQALQMIYTEQIQWEEELDQYIMWDEWLQPARQLLNAVHASGPDEFWYVYDDLAVEYPFLEDWRELVANLDSSTAYDAEQSEQFAPTMEEYGAVPDERPMLFLDDGDEVLPKEPPDLYPPGYPEPEEPPDLDQEGEFDFPSNYEDVLPEEPADLYPPGYPEPEEPADLDQDNDSHSRPPLAGEETAPDWPCVSEGVRAPSIMPTEPRVGVLLSQVRPTMVDWLWKAHLALGKITLLDGDPGLGKSNLTLDLAARLSRGDVMPDGSPIEGGAAGVVLIAPEDTLGDTIRPRLERAGAHMERILSLSMVTVKPLGSNALPYERPFSLTEDLERLEEAIKWVQAKLVIIDPVMAVLGGRDVFKDNEVRAMFAPLQALIDRLGVACLLVRHLTKNASENALYRGSGSMAFIALARIGLMVIPNPEDEQRRVLAFVKSNLARPGANLLFSITSDEERGDDRPYVRWHGESRYSLKELIAGTAPTSNLSSSRQEILRILKESYPEPCTVQQLAGALPEINRDTLAQTMLRMAEIGQIDKVSRGTYRSLTA